MVYSQTQSITHSIYSEQKSEQLERSGVIHGQTSIAVTCPMKFKLVSPKPILYISNLGYSNCYDFTLDKLDKDTKIKLASIFQNQPI